VIRVLVTGARGQVGAEVARLLGGRAEVLARDRGSLDLADAAAVARAIREARPAVVVNAAAYTAVDRAESEPSLADAVNGVAPGVMAEECRRLGALLLHFSTDYVFDGTKSSPWVEGDATGPVNVYGRSKLAGESAIAAAGGAHLILRTSWVYGPRGKNFLLTMLRAGAEREELRVVDDQHGAPTSSLDLAGLVSRLLAPGDPARALQPADVERLAASGGLYHATAAGTTTWHGFAEAIFDGWCRRVPGYRRPRVVAIPTSGYPTPAARPMNSVLSNAKLEQAFGTRIGDWRAGLERVLSALPG
jgi:dTDP-4-dehydrorhamnose reductase